MNGSHELFLKWTTDASWQNAIADFFEKNSGKKVSVQNNCLNIPPQSGHGRMYHWEVEPGISAAFWDCVLYDTIRFSETANTFHDRYLFLVDLATDVNTVYYNNRHFNIGLGSQHTAFYDAATRKADYQVRKNRHTKMLLIIADRAHLERTPQLAQLLDIKNPDTFRRITKDILMNLINLQYIIRDETVNMLYLRGKSLYILSQLLVLFSGKNPEKKSPLRDIERLIIQNKEIETNYLEPLPNISAVSAQLNMSDTKFKKIFKEVFNDTYYQYHMDHRLLISKELLRRKHIKISEIAIQIGYSSSSHFSRAFKKKFGLSPMQYHEQNLKQL